MQNQHKLKSLLTILLSVLCFIGIIFLYNQKTSVFVDKFSTSPSPSSKIESITYNAFTVHSTDTLGYFPRSIHGQVAVKLLETPYLIYPNSMLSIKQNGFPDIPLQQSFEAHYGDPIGDDATELTSITYFKVKDDQDIATLHKINEATFKDTGTDFDLIPVSIPNIDAWLAVSKSTIYQSDLRLIFPNTKAMIVIKFGKGRGKEEIVSSVREYVDFLQQPKESKKIPASNMLTDITEFDTLVSTVNASTSTQVRK